MAPAMVAVISSAVFPFRGPVATNSRSGSGSGVTAFTGSMRATGSGSTRTGDDAAEGLGDKRWRRKFSLQPPDFTKPGVMTGDGFGQLFHQRTEFADLCGQRIVRRARTPGAVLRLDGIDPAADFADLAGQIGGAARQIGNLLADIVAIAQPRRDDIVERKRGHDRERYDRGFSSRQTEHQIADGAERTGDQDHADCDEDGRQPLHVSPKSGRIAAAAPIRPPAL